MVGQKMRISEDHTSKKGCMHVHYYFVLFPTLLLLLVVYSLLVLLVDYYSLREY